MESIPLLIILAKRLGSLNCQSLSLKCIMRLLEIKFTRLLKKKNQESNLKILILFLPRREYFGFINRKRESGN